ncbi:MAG: class I SAM-dependent methyltransferase [Hyphomicrobiaceae bacterium]|nr:class I SAM-dependent methyltransferase [Hyphomicrobiaceae bacterium]
MFIANYRLKTIVQKAAMAARLPLGYAQAHPYTGLQERARTATLDFISDTMPEAIAFDTPRELMRYALSLVTLEGIVAEFGVNEGGTITFIAKQLRGRKVHGFDSFEGLPEDWSGNKMHAGYFNRQGKLPRVPSNVELHAGWFDKSLPKFVAANEGAAAFLHVDCDLYSSTVTIFDTFADRIVPGTVIVFDEYFNYPNWQRHEHKAFEEFRAKSGLDFDYVGYSIQQIAVVAKAKQS